MDDTFSDDDQELEMKTPVDEARRRFLQAKLDEGWLHRTDGYHHPNDPEKLILVDPFTGELIFTPSMAASLGEDRAADELLKVLAEWGERPEQAEGQ